MDEDEGLNLVENAKNLEMGQFESQPAKDQQLDSSRSSKSKKTKKYQVLSSDIDEDEKVDPIGPSSPVNH